MTVYVKYSNEYPYLPLAVADSKIELARMLGLTINVVASSLNHGYRTYAAVEIDDDFEDKKTPSKGESP